MTNNIELRRKKLLLTGGHAGATAYAVVEEIKSRNLDWKLFFLGSTTAVEGKKVATYEQTVLPSLGVKYVSIAAGRIQRKFSIWTIPSLIKIPVGFVGAFYHIIKINPDLVLSFGGFVAFPVVVAAKILGKKVIIHEQTAATGLANKYSSFFADKISLSRATSLKYFPKDRSEITGNPVSKEISSISPKQKLGNPQTIFITGGSRGSLVLNKVVRELLPKLLIKYKVIHQTGELHLDEFLRVMDGLTPDLRRNYSVYGLMNPVEWKKIFSEADILVTRAGANITSEVMIAKVPAIFIPIPFSYLDEQTKNAEVALEFGLGKIIRQNDLTPEILLENIENTFKNWDKIVSSVKNKTSPDITASSAIVNLLEESLK